MLADKHRAEIDAILARYPAEHRRSAAMALLYLAQREYGQITPQALHEVAGLIGAEPTQLASLVGFYTLYHDRSEGRLRVQVCNDLPCALRGSEGFVEGLCRALGVRLGETTADGMITVEGVMCLAACDRAPVFQIQDAEGIHYYEHQTVDSALRAIEERRRKAGRG